jgi:hypothetical protein
MFESRPRKKYLYYLMDPVSLSGDYVVPVVEPVAEVVPEPVAEVVPEPVAEVVPEPVSEVVPEPVAEVVPEPVAEVVAEPVAEVVAEPVSEVVPEPVSEVVQSFSVQPFLEPIREGSPLMTPYRRVNPLRNIRSMKFH